MTPGKVVNLRTGLPRKRRAGRPMAEYDQLPPPLRAWLAGAALPWSPRSAKRLWRDALRKTGGDQQQALALLSAAEQRRLDRDATIWAAPPDRISRATAR